MFYYISHFAFVDLYVWFCSLLASWNALKFSVDKYHQDVWLNYTNYTLSLVCTKSAGFAEPSNRFVCFRPPNKKNLGVPKPWTFPRKRRKGGSSLQRFWNLAQGVLEDMDGLPGNLVGVGVKVMVCGNSCARKNGRTKTARPYFVWVPSGVFFFRTF